MKKRDNYQIKVATLKEIEDRWNYEINININKKEIYKNAKDICINEVKKESRIVYIGLLNNKIICDATAIIKEEGILNEAKTKDNLVNKKRAYLCCFRTNKEYENQKYFSKLYNFLEQDLKEKNFKELSLSVDRNEKRNIEIYKNWNYINYIKTDIIYNNGNIKIYDYYYKELKDNNL